MSPTDCLATLRPSPAPLPPRGARVDAFGRVIDYLRISVTDRCNERCLYCMPEGYKGWAQRADHLTAAEIIRVVESAADIGFRKFRVTGGEPLIRNDIIEILEGIWNTPGVETLGLSTNGTRLAPLAWRLRQAGVRSLNVSLDALDPALYHRITGGDVKAVLRGLDAAQAQGFEVIKLNCVLLRGINEQEYTSLIAFAAEREMPLRFIELMPLSGSPMAGPEQFLSTEALIARLRFQGTLEPIAHFRPGHGPARYYLFENETLPRPARLGFIGALTTPHFCENCNKLRLTADGKLRPCLGRAGEVDVSSLLRQGGDPALALSEAIANKPENHEFLEGYQPGRPMTAIGG